MNAAVSDGDDSRMSRVTATRDGPEVGGEGPPELLEHVLREFLRVEPAHVVGLEDLWD